MRQAREMKRSRKQTAQGSQACGERDGSRPTFVLRRKYQTGNTAADVSKPKHRRASLNDTMPTRSQQGWQGLRLTRVSMRQGIH